MMWVFTIGSVLGYYVENLFFLVMYGEIVSRQGMIYGPFNQIYGFGAVLMVLLLTPFARKGDGWLFIGGAIVGGLFEAGCSLMQQMMFGSVSWAYSEQSMSLVGGRTSVPLMICWGVLALLYMKQVYPRMQSMINRIPKRSKSLLTCAIAVMMCANLGISALAVRRWEARLNKVPASSSIAVWLDKHFPNSMLENVYPSMMFVGHLKNPL